MRKSWVINIIAIVLLLWVWEKCKPTQWFNKKQVESTHNIVLQEISDLGKLELVKYAYKDVVEQTLKRDFLPDSKALLIIHGEVVGCIDLKKVKSEDIAVQGDTLVVTLPKAEICYHKIDHQKSKIYDTQYAFMNEALLLEEAYKKAESQILDNALQGDILRQTEHNAEQVLKPILEKSSGKKVILRYPLNTSLPRLK